MIAWLVTRTGFSTAVVETIAAVCVSVLLAGAGTFGVIHVYDAGYAAADAEWQAKALQSKIDAMTKDRDDARAAAADASLKLAAIQAQTDAEKEQTDAYIAELENRPAPSCALTDDDLRGMRAPTGASAARTGLARKARRAVPAGTDPPAKAR
jgi:hypothetical protein